MSSIGTAFTQGIIAFVATNIDDIIILLLFFSQVDANLRRRHIVFRPVRNINSEEKR